MTDELAMLRDLLPARPLPSPAAAAAARARTLHQDQSGSGRGRPPRRTRHRRFWYGLGLPLVAGAAALTVFAASSPAGPPRGSAARTRASNPAVAHPTESARAYPVASARAILLAASASAASNIGDLSTGKYWRTQTVGMNLMLTGTAAHPYEMAFWSTGDQWYAQAPGQQSWFTGHDLGAKPATAADATAWRAAGSPRSWITSVAVSMAAAAPVTSAQQLNGDVGYAVGDGTWLTAAQFRAFPADPVKLKALMIRYIYQDYSKVPGTGMPPLTESLLSEAVNLLQDPVTPPVRSAIYRVLAGLPGVRSLGPMRDPLGRSGYGIEIGSAEMAGGTYEADEAGDNAVAIISPATGALLATEVLAITPGQTILRSYPQAGGKASPRCKSQPKLFWCGLPVYYGPRYQGQVWMYTAIESMGWTNSTPSH